MDWSEEEKDVIDRDIKSINPFLCRNYGATEKEGGRRKGSLKVAGSHGRRSHNWCPANSGSFVLVIIIIAVFVIVYDDIVMVVVIVIVDVIFAVFIGTIYF